MSRIIIDAREWSTSTGRYISNLVLQLEKINDDHSYTVLMKPRDMEAWQPANSNFRKLACPYKEFTFGEQLGFKKQLDGLGADLVHFGMAQQPVRYAGKTVTTMNDLTTLRFTNPAKHPVVFWFKQRVYAWLNKKVARKATAIITYSEFVKNDVVRYAGIDADKVSAIHLAADTITDVPEPIISLQDRQFLVYVGRPTPHKNLERLIETFVELKHRHPDLVLVLAGRKDANYERIESDIRQHTIKNVVFTGHVSEGRLRWLYENCAAYVFPSLSEGFGLPGLEAMAHGAPVISSNATCLPEIYGDAALYFDPVDVTAMAGVINKVLTNKKLRADLIEKGRAQAAKYSWRRTAEQTLAVYNKVLG